MRIVRPGEVLVITFPNLTAAQFDACTRVAERVLPGRVLILAGVQSEVRRGPLAQLRRWLTR